MSGTSCYRLQTSDYGLKDVFTVIWLRMLLAVWRLSWPCPLTPWRSPLLRWRLETYGVLGEDGRLLHADEMTPSQFARFVVTHRGPLVRFLRWAASL